MHARRGIGEAIQPFDHQLNAPIIARDSAEERISHVRKVGDASSLGLNNSSGFDAQPVTHCDPQTLAADVALRCLYLDMPEKELDLLKLAAGIMAESRRGNGCEARREGHRRQRTEVLPI